MKNQIYDIEVTMAFMAILISLIFKPYIGVLLWMSLVLNSNILDCRMFVWLYRGCVVYWIICIVISFLLGILTFWTSKESKTVMTLALFGKLRKNHSLRTWSRMIEMPKRLFWLFYFTACISTLFALIYVITDTSLQDVTITLNLLLYLTHVSRRLYECLYVSIFSDSSMNILHFFLGISFYPLCVCSQVVSFISGMDNQLVSMKLLYAMLVVAVLLIQVQQHHCFVSLAALRVQNATVNTHVLPRGGFFEHCFSPHYFFEILLYLFFAIIYKLSAPMLLCFTFVVLNQTITAFWNRNWYQKHFRGSDTNRKALIPYIL